MSSTAEFASVGPGAEVFGAARWIARPVPRAQRIIRQITSTRTDWAEPGQTLGQRFRAEGPVEAVSISLTEPRGVQDSFLSPVKFTVSLRTADGAPVVERVFDGPQLVWDYFGIVLDVTPPAPPGEYVVELAAHQGTVGWSGAEEAPAGVDDGVSPLPVLGEALLDGEPTDGVRLLGVETLPAANPMFRRTFELDELPAAAELAATVLGIGNVFLNGRRVGAEALEPAVTNYDKTVLYRSWDVRHLLVAGTNEILVQAGRERYAARGGDVWGWNLAPWHREPVALLNLRLTHRDGTERAVATDAEWQAAAGPVRAERLFRGEDWVLSDRPAGWEPAAVVDQPRGELRRAVHEPVRTSAPRAPRTSTALDPTRTVYDFGDILVGRIRCRITGDAGAVLRVRSGEQRDGGGQVICENMLVAGEAQLDTVTLETGVAGYEFEPQFGYRGFRWMQVETEGNVVVADVRAVPMYTELEPMGRLSTDEPVVEWINNATALTFRNNLHGIPTDTPIYEKNGWTADAHLSTEALLHHFDLRASFGKWIEDHKDAQAADGSVPQIIPTPGWGSAADPTWSSSAILIPWYLYREYGDAGILHSSADMIRRLADHIHGRLDDDGIWRHRTWGDWLAPGHAVGPEGMAPVGTIMSAMVLGQTAAVLEELGHSDAARYREQAAAVGAAYHHAYFNPGSGSYEVPGVAYRQALNILPLAFGTVPDDSIASVRAGLIADLEDRTAGHLDCGAVGVRHLLPVLSDAGRDDLALTVLTQRTRPSWGAWYEAGESTLLESWDVDARSRNHYFLGSVASWIQQKVGGLRLLEPGWRRFEVAPVNDPRVSRAAISHRTPLGTAAVEWERGPSSWKVAVTVPENAVAELRIGRHDQLLTAGQHELHLDG